MNETTMAANAVMNVEVLTVPPDLSLEVAHRLMRERNIRHLPVVSGRKLAGIVSDRDVFLAIGRTREGGFVYPHETIGEIMSLAPISAGPGVSVGQLATTMAEKKIDALPIVSDDGALLGLVTAADIIRLVALWFPERPAPLAFQVRPISELQAHA